MPCASAVGMNEPEEALDVHDAQLDDESYFLLAETQGKLSAFNKVDVDVDDGADDDDDDDDDDKLDGAFSKSAEDRAVVLTSGTHTAGDHKPSDAERDGLLAYHLAATDTTSLLLPELQPSAGLDCANFEDLDEFNMCLNNILTVEDLSPCVQDNSHSQYAAKGNHNWNRMLTPNAAQLDDLLNIVQLGDELDLNFNDATTATTKTELANVVYTPTATATATVTATTTATRLETETPQLKEQQQNSNISNSTTTMDVISRNSHNFVNIFQ